MNAPVKFGESLPVYSGQKQAVRMHKPSLYQRSFKRIFETALIILALPIVAMVVAVMCVLVMRDGHSPFFFQPRVGRNGIPFRMMKMRTMRPNAEAVLDQHLAENPDAAKEWAHYQKLTKDPRITKIGHILRKTSLDEVPQLWNVLRGEMSLIGPRPMMPSQTKMYKGAAYFRIRPGITGLWQVSERNASSFGERASFDAEYLRTISLSGDIKIIAQTLQVMAKGTGV